MIKLIIMDVDGTLTDGSIYYSDDQTEIKRFNVKDGAGIMACQSVGKLPPPLSDIKSLYP